MKYFHLITLFLLSAMLVFAADLKAIPENTSRKLVDAFEQRIYDSVGEHSDSPGKTSLPKIKIRLSRKWQLRWQTSKSGDALIASYRTEKDADRLELGSATVFVTSIPFEGKLTDAPSVLDEAVAVQFEVQRNLPQKWVMLPVPALKREVRCYQDAQSGGADNAMFSTEPFAIKTKDGSEVWIVISVEKGITLRKVLQTLSIQ